MSISNRATTILLFTVGLTHGTFQNVAASETGTGCENHGGYPWGWNSTTLTSCRLDELSTECIDTDGDGWGWDGQKSCLVSNGNTNNLPAPQDLVESAPQFTNLETGNAVQLTRAYWDGLRDFDGRRTCITGVFDGSSYVDDQVVLLSYEYGPLGWSAPRGIVTLLSDGVVTAENWSVNNGTYSGPTNLGRSAWYEVTERGINSQPAIRSWISNDRYETCFGLSSEPNNDNLEATGAPGESFINTEQCVDTVPLGNGWGWNGSASCRVAASSIGASYTITIPDGTSVQSMPYPVIREDFEDTTWSCTTVSVNTSLAAIIYPPASATKSWRFNANGTGTTHQVGRGVFDDRFIWIWTDNGPRVAEFSDHNLSGELFSINNHPDSSYWISSPSGTPKYRPVSQSGVYSGGVSCEVSSNR